jgi:hypothetical protein
MMLLTSCAVLAISLLLAAPAACAQTPVPATLVLGTDQAESSFFGKWQRQIFIEVAKRLGVPVTFALFPLPRVSGAVESGEIDGEMNRTVEYGAAHPTLVRVEEAVVSIVFAVYTANPAHQPDGLKALPRTGVVEYRRGVLGCESALKPVVTATQLSDILTTEQGLKKLVSKRTDFYCDTDLAVLNEMSAGKAAEFSTVRKLFDVGSSTPLYPYLNMKNAALAPRIAATLKQMKTEGLIERYRRDAMRGVGQ